MNSEIKRLENEINQLRKQNLEKQKQVKFIPLNIISNNLYINDSLSNKIPKRNINNKARYNSFINKNKKENVKRNNTPLIKNYKKKTNKSYIKLPFKKGMFSYKNSIISSNPNNTYKIFNNNSSNKISYKFNNNNSLLSANLKLNIDNDEYDNNSSQIIYAHGKIPSSSSFDLNKYKIFDKNMNTNNLNKSLKNLTTLSNNSKKSMNKNIISSNNNTNVFINKNSNNSINKNTIKIQNSIDQIKISPIISKLTYNKQHNSLPLLIVDDIKDNNNINKNNNNKKGRIYDHFKDSSKHQKESRRMMIEYIKVLNRINNNDNVQKIMLKNNISKRVLNKEIIAKDFNSSNIFNNSVIIKNNNEINSDKISLNNSLINNFNNSVMNINKKVLSKNFNSPIRNNINNFLTNMIKDEKMDKINMIKYLSVPKIMKLSYLNKKHKYVCFLCPNNICYINGIEGYIFKFFDIKNHTFVGGFDLIKISSCAVNNINQNNFFIETYDGKTKRNYEFETNSKGTASYYVKCINYLSQLEKCKIYNNKNIFQ